MHELNINNQSHRDAITVARQSAKNRGNAMSNSYKEELNERLINVVNTKCNILGCDNCDLKWDGGCSATDLEAKIIEIEIKEMNSDTSSND